MFDSTPIIQNLQDQVTSSGSKMSSDVTTPMNGTHAHSNSARTFLNKANSFFTELKRRKVYRVTATYAVFAWLLIQAGSIFLPTFDAPPCVMKAVVVFLAVGFIPSAILSWVFDITPHGIKRTADVSSNEAIDIVRQLEAQAKQEFVRGYLSALIYAGLGDKAKAVDYLKREYLNRHNIDPSEISVDGMLDRLEIGRRFDAFAHRPQ